MTSLVLGHDAEVAAWVAARIPVRVSFEKCAAIGVAVDGKLIAGAVFTNYRELAHGKDIEVSFAADSPRWATRQNIRSIFSYPFTQLNCVRLTTIVSRKNKRARKLDVGLGFKLEGMVRKGYDGKYDAAVYGMLRSEADRWLKEIV
jgi:RimJ/RimL family protein N-acetyltransferase